MEPHKPKRNSLPNETKNIIKIKLLNKIYPMKSKSDEIKLEKIKSHAMQKTTTCIK